jgi:Fe-S-cluster containining protein
MEVNCAGCAGCCLDWRPLSSEPLDHERRGGRVPLDDAYNLVPLTRDEVSGFVERGYGDALTPRLFEPGERDDRVRLGGHDVAAIDGRPVFFVGLRKPPKPVAPFGSEPRWLPACVFLDPETLQCRIHGDDRYPGECSDYPGHNLALGQETECERVERVHGGTRLRDRSDPPTGNLALGPQAVGTKVFVHPAPERLDGVVDRLVRGALRAADRAEFVGSAVASSPGSTDVDESRLAAVRERVEGASSWVGRAIEAWEATAGAVGADATGADTGVDDRLGAPSTPGWEANGDKG